MFQNYRISQAERVPFIMHWLGRQGLQLLESLNEAEQEAWNTEKVSLKYLIMNQTTM